VVSSTGRNAAGAVPGAGRAPGAPDSPRGRRGGRGSESSSGTAASLREIVALASLACAATPVGPAARRNPPLQPRSLGARKRELGQVGGYSFRRV